MAFLNFGKTEVPVFDRFAKGFPQHAVGEPATYGPASEGFVTPFAWDAHFAAYSFPSVERRLAGARAFELRDSAGDAPKMCLWVVDVDGPDHAASDEWWAGEREKVRALFAARGRGYCYRTKGGYRIVYGLRDELPLTSRVAAARWRASYQDWLAVLFRDFAIHGDPACADWARCFRLPRVRRDGIDVAPIEEIGEADRILEWREPYCGEDDPRVARDQAPAPEVAEAAPVEEDRLVEAAQAIIEAWPPRSRHFAGLALCGALARAGWSDGAIADFVSTIVGMTNPTGDPEWDKWQKTAVATCDKVARGEDVSGWPSLIEHMLTGTDGQKDESRRALAEAGVLSCRRAIGQGPAIDLFDTARAASRPPPLEEQLDAACAEVGGDVDFRALLDEAATVLQPIVQSTEEKFRHQVDARPMGMSLREIRQRNAPAPEFLVQNLITREGIGAISGEPKAGKSFDATLIAMCVAAGAPVYGQFAVQHPAGVFYFYHEDTESSINNRTRAMAVGLGIDPEGPWLDRFVAQPRGRALDILQLADLCVLVASVWRHERQNGQKIELIVVDPLSNVHSGEEDKRDSMRVVMARLAAVEQVLKAALVFVHHSGKASGDNKGRKRGGQKMRGSSVIHGAVDFGLYFDDIRGDRKGEFIALGESEVKAARGGGKFDRTITITDDEKGNATVVRFKIGEPQSAAPAPGQPGNLAEERAVTVVQKLFNHGAPLTGDELQRKIGGGRAILQSAIESATESKWIQIRYHGGQATGYEITDAGRELVRGGHAPPEDDASPAGSAHPAAGFIVDAVRSNN